MTIRMGPLLAASVVATSVFNVTLITGNKISIFSLRKGMEARAIDKAIPSKKTSIAPYTVAITLS